MSYIRCFGVLVRSDDVIYLGFVVANSSTRNAIISMILDVLTTPNDLFRPFNKNLKTTEGRWGKP